MWLITSFSTHVQTCTNILVTIFPGLSANAFSRQLSSARSGLSALLIFKNIPSLQIPLKAKFLKYTRSVLILGNTIDMTLRRQYKEGFFHHSAFLVSLSAHK